MVREPNRVWACVYGAAFHAVAVAAMIGVALWNRAPLSLDVLARGVPSLLVAAAVLYFFVVGPYIPGRSSRKGVVFFDSAVGMFVECAVVALTSILYALIATAPTVAAGLGTFGGAFLSTSAFTLLWMYANFFTQILIIGNAAGLVGWLVLKKLAERAAKRAASPSPG